MCVFGVERVTHQKKCSLSLEIIKPPPPLRHCCLPLFKKQKRPHLLSSRPFSPLSSSSFLIPCSILNSPTPTPPPHPPSLAPFLPSASTYPPTPQNSTQTSECQPSPACSLCRYTKTRKISKFSFHSLAFLHHPLPLSGSNLGSLFLCLLFSTPGL